MSQCDTATTTSGCPVAASPPSAEFGPGAGFTGVGGGDWTLCPAADGGLLTVVAGIGDVTASVTSSAHDFVRWGTKRCDWRTCCTLAGDEAYATQVLDTLNII